MNVEVFQMSSIDTLTDAASSEASPTIMAAIGNKSKDNEDLGDISDEEPPFPLYGSFDYAEASLIDLLYIGLLAHIVERSYVLRLVTT